MKEVFGNEKGEKKEAKKEAKKEKKDVKKEEKKEVKETKKENKENKENKETKKEVKKASAPAPVAREVKSAEKKAEAPAPAEKEAAKDTVKEAAEPKQPRVPADPAEVCRRAETFLNDVFRTMEMEVEVKTQFEEDMLSVDLVGNDMGILIGKRGQTLDSLQYLTSLVVNKGKAAYVRVKLDTEDYRSRRKATLENLAKNIAFKVKKTRRPIFLEPMNPYERRIIHSALQNDPYVTTHSEGEEPCRKVVVTLRKK